MVKEFNSLEEIQKYYDEETNTYIFKEDREYFDTVEFNFNLNVEANIEAYDIETCDINVWNINACNIKANNIYANNINANHIKAHNIYALDIKVKNIIANDISAGDINAWNIDANDISYWAVCFAYNSIKCNSITSKRENHKHFVLDGELVVEEDEKED